MKISRELMSKLDSLNVSSKDLAEVLTILIADSRASERVRGTAEILQDLIDSGMTPYQLALTIELVIAIAFTNTSFLPEGAGSYDKQRKERLKAAGWTEADWRQVRQEVLEAHLYVCSYCDSFGNVVDHDIPITRGGKFERSNLVCACVRCNSRKKGLTGDEFRRRMALEESQ